MKNKLHEIPDRIVELREILEISTQDMADRLGVDCPLYEEFEKGEADIPVSTLYEIAAALGVDLTVLLTGEAPRMDTVCVVRDGQGVNVERYPGYGFESLAYNFKNRKMEPLLVSIDPSDQPPPMVRHKGQESNFVVQGIVRITVGYKTHILGKGDSIYFDPNMLHGQAAVDGPAKFLSVILED